MYERLVSNSYLSVDNAEQFVIEYYMITYSKGNFGIRVASYQNDIPQNSRQFFLPYSKNEIMNIINILAKNFVFPVSLDDILRELGKASVKQNL